MPGFEGLGPCGRLRVCSMPLPVPMLRSTDIHIDSSDASEVGLRTTASRPNIHSAGT